MQEERFNLIDEPWIPIVDVGSVSLKQLFSNSEYLALGGNPIQKIALMKLFLAISQAAYTPKDNEDWTALTSDGLAKKCLTYLDKWHDSFYLYGEKPFLQLPEISAAGIQSYGAVQAAISTGNTTVRTQSQVDRGLTSAEKALLIIQLMGLALGGKKADNSIVLSLNYHGKNNENGKPTTGKPGPSLGFLGFLHNFIAGDSLHQSLWLNLFTKAQVEDLMIYTEGIGVPPWEGMPNGESCPTAIALKKSLMGRLIPLSRFCLLVDEGLHYSEGIFHDGYKEGAFDPSISVSNAKEPKAIWANPEKRPWRELTSLLSFFSQSSGNAYDCQQLRLTLERAIKAISVVGVWSGGLRVSSNAGEQYVSGSDDYVESKVTLPSSALGEIWFANLQKEMEELDVLSKTVYGTTLNYFKNQNMEGKDRAALASNLFWQLCERKFQDLVDVCGRAKDVNSIRPVYAGFAHKSYDTFCSKDTARQIDSWAKNRPNLVKYLKK